MKNKKFFCGVICLMLLFGIAACGADEGKQPKRTYPEFLTAHAWEYNTLSCAEILRFHKDGRFSYYEVCGNPVGNSDCYETYSYSEGTKIVTVHGSDESVEDFEIEILRNTEDSLLVRIDGVIKEFYANNDVPTLRTDMYDKVEGYSAYMALGEIHGNMIETAPYDFDADAGGREEIREEQLAETVEFYRLYEEVVHAEGETPDEITSEFTEITREDVAHSEDNSFSAGYIWYNEKLEITKIVYYGVLETWE